MSPFYEPDQQEYAPANLAQPATAVALAAPAPHEAPLVRVQQKELAVQLLWSSTTWAPSTSEQYMTEPRDELFASYDELPDTLDAEENLSDVYYNSADYIANGNEDAAALSAFEEKLIRLSFLAGYVYMLLAVTGILLNAYVIARLIQLAINDYCASLAFQERFKHGCGLPLAAMSLSDLCSLLSIIAAVVLGGFVPPSLLSSTAHSAHCKITIYLIHSMTGFSTWCWLFISALRYIAVYHPLWHIKGGVLGTKAVTYMLLFALVINAWLPVVVVSSQRSVTCEEQPLSMGADWNRMLHGIELCWSYLLPAVLTLALDVRVILVRPPSFAKMAQKRRVLYKKRGKSQLRATLSDSWSHAEVQLRGCFCVSWCSRKTSKTPRISIVNEDAKQDELASPDKLSHLVANVGRARTLTNTTYGASTVTNGSSLTTSPSGLNRSDAYAQHSWQSTCSHTAGHTKRGRRTVRRWLAITTIHLLLNAPDSLYRLANVIDTSPPSNSPTNHLIALVVRLLYFAQFCFNAAYLTAIVYRRNVRPKPRKVTSKNSTTYLRVHPEYSRPQTRVGIRDESRRQSMRHQQLKRRYSADPRAGGGADLGARRLSKCDNRLSVRQPLLNAAPLCPSYSTETFRSEELELNSLGSVTVLTSPRSPSTEPRNELSPIGSSGRTSAGLPTYASSEAAVTPMPDSSRPEDMEDEEEQWDETVTSGNAAHFGLTKTSSWQV